MIPSGAKLYQGITQCKYSIFKNSLLLRNIFRFAMKNTANIQRCAMKKTVHNEYIHSFACLCYNSLLH